MPSLTPQEMSAASYRQENEALRRDLDRVTRERDVLIKVLGYDDYDHIRREIVWRLFDD